MKNNMPEVNTQKKSEYLKTLLDFCSQDNVHVAMLYPRINSLDREFKNYLMNPHTKAKTSYFLLDIDDIKADLELIARKVYEIGSKVSLTVPTKNGYYMLILPCNLNKLRFDKVKVKIDAIVCLYFK